MNQLRIIPIVAASLFAGACGFHPLYGNAAAGSGLSRAFASVYVEPIRDTGVAATGFELRNALIDLLDSNAGAAYRLKVTVGETTQGLALLSNASITRYNDRLTANYQLTDAATGNVIVRGSETGLSAYNVVASPYASLVAQQDADKRAVQDIAQRIRIDLGVFFEQKKLTQQ
jgi:LPS-assembly lipoprotein